MRFFSANADAVDDHLVRQSPDEFLDRTALEIGRALAELGDGNMPQRSTISR